MKLQTAFKLSALAVALASTSSVFAATANDTSTLAPGWNPNGGAFDSSTYQFVDVGSGVTTASPTGTQVTNQLTALHLADNGDYYLQIGENDAAKYYKATVDSSVAGQLNVTSVDYTSSYTQANVSTVISDTTKPVLGGLTQVSTSTSTETTDVKVVDGNFLQYGQTTNQIVSNTTASGNLTDDNVGSPLLTGTVNGSTTTSTPELISDKTITVGNINPTGTNAPGALNTGTVHGLQINELDNTAGSEVEKSATLTVNDLTLSDNLAGTSTVISANGITVNGSTVATVDDVDAGDAATLASANAYTDSTATTLRSEIAAGDAATLADANAYTDSTATTLRTEIAAGDAATLATARTELAAGDAATLATARTELAAGDAATLTAANANTAATATTLRTELAAGDAATLTAAKTHADAGDVATLAAANSYTDTQVANFGSRVNQLNSRINDVEKSAYRGVAIALAAQQQVPNIAAGQVAVFGGIGHYEGESAGALGLASVFADGRTSVSAALGVAGGGDIGGRVGVAYVFGGK